MGLIGVAFLALLVVGLIVSLMYQMYVFAAAFFMLLAAIIAGGSNRMHSRMRKYYNEGGHPEFHRGR